MADMFILLVLAELESLLGSWLFGMKTDRPSEFSLWRLPKLSSTKPLSLLNRPVLLGRLFQEEWDPCRESSKVPTDEFVNADSSVS